METKPTVKHIPELIGVGKRTISTHGWRIPLVEEHLRGHSSTGLSQKWCSPECLARTFFGRNTQANRASIRRRLSRAFRMLLQHDLFLVIERNAHGPGAHGEVIALKLYEGDAHERAYAAEQVKRMRARRDLTDAQVRHAEQILGTTLEDDPLPAA